MTDLVSHLLLLVGGFGALYFGAEWLVRGAARIATYYGVSPIVVGLTLVSLGTSAPELVVCVMASLRGEGGLVAGNILGSNLANIGLILGATALISPLRVADRVISREVPIMIVITIFVFPLMWDGDVSRGEGLVLLLLLVVYVAFTFITGEEEVEEILHEVEGLAAEPEEGPHLLRNLGLVMAGGAGLGFGGWAIVEGAHYLTVVFGISESVVGFTVVAIGTSLPELITSVVAAVRRQADIAVGNVVGSNIFNLTAVMGGAAMARGFAVEQQVLELEFPTVVLISIVLWPVVTTAKEVRRGEGVFLLIAYIGFVTWLGIGQ